MTPESHTMDKGIKEMIIDLKKLSINKFSLSAPWEMYREQYGEYSFWC